MNDQARDARAGSSQRNWTPGALRRWQDRRRASIHHALDVARTHVDNESPMRAVVALVDVPLRATPRGAEIIIQRLQLECGHLVPLPGGALVNRTQPGQMRRCKPCRDGEPA